MHALLGDVLIGQENGCWGWTGPTDQHGLPTIRFQGRTHSVRRVLWLLWSGSPPPLGHSVRTSCGHVDCLNPDHLYVRLYVQGYVRKRSKRWFLTERGGTHD